MTHKTIMQAQKVLRKLEGTPIIVKPDNSVQVTYEHETYSALFEVLVAVSKEQLGESETVAPSPYAQSITEYHREKV